MGEGFTIVWNTAGLRPVFCCFACSAEEHDLCDGFTERTRWFRRVRCGCDHRDPTEAPE